MTFSNHKQPLWEFSRLICGSLLVVSLSFGVACAEDVAPALTPKQQERLKASEIHWIKTLEFLTVGKRAEAIASIKLAIAIEREVYGNEHDRILEISIMLAELHEVQEQFAEGLLVRSEVVSVLAKRLGEKHWRVTDARLAADDCRLREGLSKADRIRLSEAVKASHAADTFYSQARYSEALERAQFVVERRRELLGNRNPTYALSVAKLAMAQSAAGNYELADSLYGQALEIEKTSFGELHPEFAKTLSNLAVLCDETGDFRRAEELYAQAMEIRRRTLGEEHSDFAASLNNLAVHFDQLGDFARAEPLYQQSVEIMERALGERHPDAITALNNLGRHLQSRGDLIHAEPILIKTLKLRKEVLGEQHPQYANSLVNLALLYVAQHDLDRAEPLFQQALEIRKMKLGEGHPDYATGLGQYADLINARADFPRAAALYREVLDIRRRTLGERHPHLASALTRLSLSLLHQGKVDEALPLAREAAQIDRQNVDAVALVQSDRQQLLTAKQSYANLDALLSIMATSGRVTDADYNEVLQVKGRVWQRQQAARAIARTATDRPDLANQIEQLRLLAATRAKLTLAIPGPEGLEGWRARLAELADRQEKSERDLAAKSELLQATRRPVSPADLRRDLPEGTVLVDIFEYLHVMTPPAKPGAAAHQRRLAAFVIRSDVQETKFVSLGATRPVSREIEIWRGTFGSSPESQAAARSLKQKLWTPLEPCLAGAKLILISPDGALGRFPFAALPGKDPGSYLLEERSLAVVPCAMAIHSILQQETSIKRVEVPGNLLIVGNVDFDARAAAAKPASAKSFGRRVTAMRGSDWKGFTPLLGARGEMASLERLYRHVFGADGITLLEGAGAREERFCEEVVRHKHIHVATHGFFAPSPLKTALAVNPTGQGPPPYSSADTEILFLGYPPGLQSGIALAGANRDPEPDFDDGILTAAEVENLDLRGAQLVVLSACETGLGEIASGEGLLGLQRAFQVAGAQSVVASLWSVSDDATRSLMESFYENMFQNEMGTLEALRAAQLRMLREGRQRGLLRQDLPQANNDSHRTPPFYWAAFILSGDWR